MGQRLVLNVYRSRESLDNDYMVCSIYYHWSGYTYSALCEIKQIRDVIVSDFLNYTEDMTDHEIVFAINKKLNESGGGIKVEEFDEFQLKFPNDKFDKCNNRNYGIISFTSEGIKYLNAWAESLAYYFIEEDEVEFDTYELYNGYDSYKEYYLEELDLDEDDICEYENIPESPCSFSDTIDGCNIDALCELMGSKSIARYGNEIYVSYE